MIGKYFLSIFLMNNYFYSADFFKLVLPKNCSGELLSKESNLMKCLIACQHVECKTVAFKISTSLCKIYTQKPNLIISLRVSGPKLSFILGLQMFNYFISKDCFLIIKLK